VKTVILLQLNLTKLKLKFLKFKKCKNEHREKSLHHLNSTFFKFS